MPPHVLPCALSLSIEGVRQENALTENQAEIITRS